MEWTCIDITQFSDTQNWTCKQNAKFWTLMSTNILTFLTIEVLLFMVEMVLVVGTIFGLYDTWGHGLFFMHIETFSRQNECTTCVSKGASSKFEKFMGYVLGRTLFIMHEKYFLKCSYTFYRDKCSYTTQAIALLL